jgi:hypothetical protein
MIIGFSGKKGSGKTTAAKYALGMLPGAELINFKTGLIKEMKERLKETLEHISYEMDRDIDWLFEQKPPVIRALMRDYGTLVRRGDNPDYWTQRWLENTAWSGNVIVDDIRFLNESSTVRNQGGIIIRVARSVPEDGDTHQSEIEMDQIHPDFVITNDGTVEELYAQVDKLMQTIVYNR